MLKKFNNKLILLISLFLFIPIVTFADMGMPSLTKYEVVITNKDGASLYDWSGKAINKKLNYNQVITINSEITINGELYGLFEIDGVYQNGYIKLSDTRVKSQDIDLSKFNEVNKTYIVLKDIKLYAGPSIVYGTIENAKTIPAGTVLKASHSDELWFYTEYEKEKGWVYSYPYLGYGPNEEKSSVAEYRNGEIYVLKDIKDVKSNPLEDGNLNITIPKDTILSYDYSYDIGPSSTYYHTKYNNQSVWVMIKTYDDNENGALKNDKKIYLLDSANIDVYKDYLSQNKYFKIKAPGEYKTSFQVLDYSQEGLNTENSLFYIEDESGKKGWISGKNLKIAIQTTSIFKANKNVILYDSPLDNKKDTDIVIKKNEEVKTLYSLNNDDKLWYYFNVNGKYGWMTSDDFTYLTEYELEDKRKEEKDPNSEKKEENTEKLSTKDMVIYAVLGASGLAIVTVVIILLVNRKSKRKNKVKKQETFEFPDESKINHDNEKDNNIVYCSKCGAANSKDTNFCGKCGNKIGK